MISTNCLGPCVRAAVVAVGWARMGDRSLDWLSPPVCWGSTETPQHAAALTEWISASGPTLGTEPADPSAQR